MSEPTADDEESLTTPDSRTRPRTPHRGYPRPLRDLNRGLRILGPGLLWMAPLALPLAIAVQEMCGRIGIVIYHGLAGIIRRHYARPVLYGAADHKFHRQLT